MDQRRKAEASETPYVHKHKRDPCYLQGRTRPCNNTIGITKFADLRPPNVLLNSETPSNVCQCIYHQNSTMTVNAVHNYLTDIPQYTKDFPASCLDCPEIEECWFGTCSHESCGFADVYTLPNEPHLTELPAKWNKWQAIDGRLVKHEETGSVANLHGYCTSSPLPKILQALLRQQIAIEEL